MEKYGNMVAFTNLKEIENWILEQKEYVKKYLKIDIFHLIINYSNIEFIGSELVSRWKSNPSRYLLVDEDELNSYISSADRYMAEMKKFAESKNIDEKDSDASITEAHNQMKKFSSGQLKKMFLMCDKNIEMMRRLMMFLSFDCIEESIIYENLSNDNPIPFIEQTDLFPSNDTFLTIPTSDSVRNYSFDPGYRYDLSFSSEGKEILNWMDYCTYQRESFEKRYKKTVYVKKV